MDTSESSLEDDWEESGRMTLNEYAGPIDPEESRCLRKKYADLIITTKEKGQKDDSVLTGSFQTADELFEQVHKPREAIFDSKLISLQANIVKQKTQKLKTTLHDFKPTAFAELLVGRINRSSAGTPGEKSPNVFKVLGKISQRVLSPSPSHYPLFNTFDNSGIKKKARKRKAKVDDEISKIVEKPESVDASGKDRDTDSFDIAEHILSILHRLHKKSNGPICYFSFVVNPDSFSETIENMVEVSMLAKEGAVKISLDKQKLPVIEPIDKEQMKEVKLNGTYTQSILSFDQDYWRTIVKEYGITRSVIKRK